LSHEKSSGRRVKRGRGALSVARIAQIGAPDVEPDEPHEILASRLIELHPHAAVERLFVNDSFAGEVDAFIEAQRQREREEAAREAGE
jgi:hypothetical protein